MADDDNTDLVQELSDALLKMGMIVNRSADEGLRKAASEVLANYVVIEPKVEIAIASGGPKHVLDEIRSLTARANEIA